MAMTFAIGGGAVAQEGNPKPDKTDLEGLSVSVGAGYSSQESKAEADGFKEVAGGVATLSVFNDSIKRANSKLNGHAGLGYGKFINNIFCGIEAGVDISKNRDCDGKLIVASVAGYPPIGVKFKNSGVIPSARLRVGHWFDSLGGMVYASLGASRVGVDFTGDGYWNNGGVGLKIVPLIGLGFEKVVYDKVSIKLEGDYRFKSKKSGTLFETKPDNIDDSFAYKVKTNGYAVRFAVNYHIN
jgi:hypothetical protein